MTEPTSAVERAIAERIARVRAEGERRRQQREELAAARQRGLAHRHAAKLRNLANSQHTEETAMPAALRTAHCPSCRRDRQARLMTTVSVAGAPHDVLKCGSSECELLWCVRAERPRSAPAAA